MGWYASNESGRRMKIEDILKEIKIEYAKKDKGMYSLVLLKSAIEAFPFCKVKFLCQHYKIEFPNTLELTLIICSEFNQWFFSFKTFETWKRALIDIGVEA